MRYVSPSPFGTTIFCDDVRAELGNKLSYMGVYKGYLFTSEALPQILPKLCAVIQYSEPDAIDPVDLKVRVYLPGKEGSENPDMEIDVSLAELVGKHPVQNIEQDRRARQFLLPVTFAPFVIEREGFVRIEVVRGGDIYRCGALMVGGPRSPGDPLQFGEP